MKPNLTELGISVEALVEIRVNLFTACVLFNHMEPRHKRETRWSMRRHVAGSGYRVHTLLERFICLSKLFIHNQLFRPFIL
jgi:hypothetical protein